MPKGGSDDRSETARTPPVRAVIFDRDGVLNVDHGYVGQVERLEWTPGARTAVARLNAQGTLAIVATNQSGVARGYFDMAAVEAVHAAMAADLAAEGGRLDAIYVCPFHEDGEVAAFRVAVYSSGQVTAHPFSRQ